MENKQQNLVNRPLVEQNYERKLSQLIKYFKLTQSLVYFKILKFVSNGTKVRTRI